MAWIPSQDPWGVGMLASGAMFGISLLVINARRMAVRSRTGPVIATGLAVSAFLACAAMGTLERVAQGPSGAEQEAEDPSVDAATPEPLAAPEGESEAAPTQGEADAGSPTDGTNTVAARNSALEPTDAMPASEDERAAAIRKILRTARSVYESGRDCKDAKAVGQTWAAVSGIPDDAQSSRVGAVVRKLEACRRQVRGAITYKVHRDRIAARDDFADTLKQRLQEQHGIKGTVAVTGDNHQRIRVGNGTFDEASAGTIVTQAFKDELTGLGFERVVLANAKESWRTDLEPRPESDIVGDELVPYGLDAKLALRPTG